MARRTRMWLNYSNEGTLATASTTWFRLLSTLDTHVGVHEEGMTVERVIGSIFYRLAAPVQAHQRAGFALDIGSEHLDTDDYPSLFDGVGRWLWQAVDYASGVSHDSTALADQRPLTRIPVDSALVRKIRPGTDLRIVIQNDAGQTLEFAFAVRILLIRP